MKVDFITPKGKKERISEIDQSIDITIENLDESNVQDA